MSSFGTIRKLPSGNWQARFSYKGERHSAPTTFRLKSEAQVFLARVQTEIANGTFIPFDEREALAAEEKAKIDAQKAREAAKQIPFGTYATKWIRERTNSRGEPLKPTSKAEYERYLATGKLAYWKDTPIPHITPDAVRSWYIEEQQDGHRTSLAKQYDFMKSVLKTAVEDGLITVNPCTVKGGSRASTGKKVTPPTDDELDKILEVLPTKYEVIAVIAAAGGLRKGEILALKTNDIAVVRVESGEVASVDITVNKSLYEAKDGTRGVGEPKTLASVRHVEIFGKDATTIADYIADKSPDAYIWTNRDGTKPMPMTTLQDPWEKARDAAGRPDLTFHALRHYQGTRYAQSGATLKEIMARLGHNDVNAAMRYQHAGGRSAELARKAARN
ncbi:site-specific integrase [Corynebacterium hadale]|uniref:site-specific integrase n=1 Tax=Corynebacterium hadale TaxID=2026255 RepID=UPI000BAA794B|nr:site-specific integrase [Corynebacterium hadale]PAT13284.1 integrase [Corynebacterium hadale]